MVIRKECQCGPNSGKVGGGVCQVCGFHRIAARRRARRPRPAALSHPWRREFVVKDSSPSVAPSKL